MKHLNLILAAVLVVLPFMEIIAQAQERPIVEVIYFHGLQRCRTCVALQKAAAETVQTKFAEGVKNGRVRLIVMDLSTREGAVLAEKYRIAWSSLIIVRKQDGKERMANLTEWGFRYAVNHKARIQAMIERQINEFLR